VIKVSVHESKSFDPAVISRLLEDEPLPTRHEDDVPMGPFLTLDGRVHRPTSDFLRSYAGARAESGTARRYASDLRGWLDFLCNVRGATLAGTTVRGRAQQLVALCQATQISGRHDLLGLHRPWGGQQVTDVFAKGSKLNQVRPHEDVGNVLGFVAWFFDNIAENIVEHVEWWTSNVSQDPAYSNEVAAEEKRELLLDLAAKNGNALPASHNVSGGASLAAAPLARLIGIYDADEAYTIGRSAFLKMHPKPRLVVGVTPCPVPIVEVPDADGALVSWTHSLLPAKNELDVWQRRLVYYAMFYLAATVMLRDSQLATLPIDPVRTEEITRPSGVTYTKHILSAFKTKNRTRLCRPRSRSTDGSRASSSCCTGSSRPCSTSRNAARARGCPSCSTSGWGPRSASRCTACHETGCTWTSPSCST